MMKQLVVALALFLGGILVGSQTNVWPRVQSNNLVQNQSEPLTIAIPEVVQQTIPAVVTVSVVNGTSRSPAQTPFDRFFGDQELERNIGSGFIVNSGGLIITNKHVVDDPELQYRVIFNNGDSRNVEQIYRDPLNDLAILKVSALGLPTLQLGDASDLRLGESVVAIGTSLGEFTNSVTSGIISGLGRGIEAGSPYQGYVEQLEDVIQTDAAINPGNSGGPLLNLQGQVIGVNTAVAVSGQNLGFAIPVDIVNELLRNFEARGGSFERPFVGVRFSIITPQMAQVNQLPLGAYVREVITDSPAARAGLQAGDIIIQFNGTEVGSSSETSLSRLISRTTVGETVTVVVWRSGQTLERQLQIGSSTS